ncbi:hypothetical protein CRG98_022213 [Punica granatum]|uniref:Uncharacterized protein n=1 Tax=Punica granatum TaxID=22663 RepID=A0A2I0JM69_PUNGR|nr:hypothetical protein CRG98_022213 [Punica granatum]
MRRRERGSNPAWGSPVGPSPLKRGGWTRATSLWGLRDGGGASSWVGASTPKARWPEFSHLARGLEGGAPSQVGSLPLSSCFSISKQMEGNRLGWGLPRPLR